MSVNKFFVICVAMLLSLSLYNICVASLGLETPTTLNKLSWPNQLIEWQPTGDLIALSNATNVWVVSATTGQQIKYIETRAYVSCIEWSPDGTRLALLKLMSPTLWKLEVWRVDTWEILYSISEEDVQSFNSKVFWHGNGNLLVLTGTDEIQVRSAADGQLIREIVEPISKDMFVPDDSALSPNGTTVAALNYGTIYLWRIDTGELITTLSGEPSALLAWSPDSSQLATTVESRNVIQILDVVSGEPVARLATETYTIKDLEWSTGGLAAASFNKVHIWDVPQQTLKETLYTGEGVTQVTWSPDGQKLAYSTDGNVEIYSLAPGDRG